MAFLPGRHDGVDYSVSMSFIEAGELSVPSCQSGMNPHSVALIAAQGLQGSWVRLALQGHYALQSTGYFDSQPTIQQESHQRFRKGLMALVDHK